jgi:hypothetical protein
MSHRRRLLATLLALSTAGTLAPPAQGQQGAGGEGAEAQEPELGLAASEVLLAEGMLAFAERRDGEARQVLAEAAAADPQNGTALHWLGLADLRLGRSGEAVGALTAALAARRPPEAGKRRVAADLATARLAAAAESAPGQPPGAAAAPPLGAMPVFPGPAVPPVLPGPAAPPVFPGPAAPPVLPGPAVPPFLPEPAAPPVLYSPAAAQPPPPVPASLVTAPPFSSGPLPATGLPPRWEGRLSLEAAYDSNPGLLPADATFLPLTGNRPSGAATDGAADVDLRLEAHPLDDRGAWRLGLGMIGNRSAYRQAGDLDLGLAGGFVQVGRGQDPRGYLTGPLGFLRVPSGDGRLGLLLQAAETWIWLGGRDYLRVAAGGAGLTLRGPRATATHLDLSASQLRFAGDSPGDLRRSGSEIAAELSESLFTGGGGYLRVVLGGGERQAGRAFAHRFWQVAADAAAPLGGGWTLYLQGARRQERFGHPQSNLTQPAGPMRDDRSWRGSAALVRMLGRHLAGTARAGYVRRDSNVLLPGRLPLFAYRRTIAGLGISWFF